MLGYNRFGWIAAGCLVVVAVLVYQSGGAAMLAGQPTVVVTVNLATVLEKLDQRTDAETNLRNMVEALRVEDDQRKAEITKLDNELRAMTESSQKQALQDQAALSALKYQAWARFSADKVDIERGLVLEDLYRSIKAAAAELASTARYDVLLVDDSQGELATSPDARVSRESQIRQQIAGRRMLFASPAIDITDDLIERMNNAYKAITVKPATP